MIEPRAVGEVYDPAQVLCGLRIWRGGREAEGGGLLNRCTVKSCTGGSNPPLSAPLLSLRCRAFSVFQGNIGPLLWSARAHNPGVCPCQRPAVRPYADSG